MPIPHSNYYPPAGQIIDASDRSVTYDGRLWIKNGRPFSPPSSHRLIGVGPMSGWYYDWQKRAWMEPDRPQPPSSPVRPQPTTNQPAQMPGKEPNVSKELTKETKTNMFEALVKHPAAPILGGLLLVASYLTDEPTPPEIPPGLPEPQAKQWQMIFAQNQQRFQRRMAAYENLGMVLLGYASTQSLLEAMPKRA